jgi:hypothetical protein
MEHLRVSVYVRTLPPLSLSLSLSLLGVAVNAPFVGCTVRDGIMLSVIANLRACAPERYDGETYDMQ